LVFVGDAEPQSAIEPQRGIGLYHAEGDSLVIARRLLDQNSHKVGADPLSLEARVDEELREKEGIVC
jgi:hypothetical protein